MKTAAELKLDEEGEEEEEEEEEEGAMADETGVNLATFKWRIGLDLPTFDFCCYSRTGFNRGERR